VTVETADQHPPRQDCMHANGLVQRTAYADTFLLSSLTRHAIGFNPHHDLSKNDSMKSGSAMNTGLHIADTCGKHVPT
jgi:hypothetical protein